MTRPEAKRRMIVLTIGDSITAAGKWQTELARLVLLDAATTLDIRNVGVGGVSTPYWPNRIAALLATHQPDMVTLFTGTNDDIHAVRFGEPATGWAWRSVVEAIRNYRTPPPAIVPAFIGYSDPLIAPDWLLASQPQTNDTLYREITRPGKEGWFAGVADFQQMPATADYLDDGGIHPTGRGYKVMGRIVYDAIHAGMGWPPCSEPALCGMYGHRKGYPRPVGWTPCSCGG